LASWGHADSPWPDLVEPLAGIAAIGHILDQAAQPGGRCSQGGVKVPTGGKG